MPCAENLSINNGVSTDQENQQWYRVEWHYDVQASTPEEAARKASSAQQDKEGYQTFDVIEGLDDDEGMPRKVIDLYNLFGTFELVIHYLGNNDIHAIAAEADYSVTHKLISHTEIHDVSETNSTITVKCYLELDLAEESITGVVEELDYAFIDESGDELPMEAIDFAVHK